MIGFREDVGESTSPTDNSDRVEGGPIGLKESMELDVNESELQTLSARRAALPVRKAATREQVIARRTAETRLFIDAFLYLNCSEFFVEIETRRDEERLCHRSATGKFLRSKLEGAHYFVFEWASNTCHLNIPARTIQQKTRVPDSKDDSP